jgi:hypothetical protein
MISAMRWVAVGAVVVVGVAAVVGTTADAGVAGMQQLKLDFTKADVAKQVSWTKSANLKLGPKGLVHDAGAGEMVDLTLQTTEPFATGMSWRPAHSVSVGAAITPVASPIKLPNGQTHTPYAGRMFARYSPDAKHWSSWHVMSQAPEAGGGYRYRGELAVTNQDAAAYGELVAKYATLDVPWRSDEDAAVRWIVASQPDFFAKHLPFVGYVQFLYEGSLYGGQRIERIDFDVAYGIGGAHYPPKNPKDRDKHTGPWRYRAP